MPGSLRSLPLTCLVVLPLTLAVAGCGSSPPESESPDGAATGEAPSADMGDPDDAPELPEQTEPPVIDLQQVDRAKYDELLGQYDDRVVLVDFWANWCIPCVKNFHHIVEMHEKYADEGLVVIAVSMDETDDETLATTRAFLVDHEADFLTWQSAGGGDETAFEAFEIPAGIPHYKLYHEGKVVQTFPSDDPENPSDHTDIEAAVRELLGSNDSEE